MATEADFRQCVTELDNVTHAFLTARKGLNAPSKYEADLAGFKLMEMVFRHVNAVSCIALLPDPGSHRLSAEVLIRSAFEIGLTAYWLTLEDDWQERESRWLGWVIAEEEFQRKVASDLRLFTGNKGDDVEEYIQQLEVRRLAIAQQLPKDARKKRPNIQEMLKECRIDKRYYIAYRVGSECIHGGPVACREIFETGKNFIRTKVVKYSSWVHTFNMAGWCIAQPGSTALLRAGATPTTVTKLFDAHGCLRAAARKLEA